MRIQATGGTASRFEGKAALRTDWDRIGKTLHWRRSESTTEAPTALLAWNAVNAHSHGFDEILVCLQGPHWYGIDGSPKRFESGAVELLPKMRPHDSGYTPLHGPGIDLWLHLLPHGYATMNFFCLCEDGLGAPLALPSPSIGPLKGEIQKLYSLLERPDLPATGGSAKAQRYIVYLVHELLDWLASGACVSPALGNATVMENIKRYIDRNLVDALSLSDLAKVAGYSPFHFHRLFVEFEGRTPRQYVEERRLKCACELMKCGKSVTSAAMDAGFASPAQLDRVFRRKMDMPPTHWLRRTN